MAWQEIIEAIAASGVAVSMTFDKDYGIDKRSGWTLVVDGAVLSQLEPSPEKAIVKEIGNLAFTAYSLRRG